MNLFLHSNAVLRRTSYILLLIALMLTSIGASSPLKSEQKPTITQTALSNYLAAQRNKDLDDEEKIKFTIDAYFTARYESQKTLEPQDFSLLLRQDKTLDWVEKEKDRRDIELYVAKLFGLRYQRYRYTIDYESIEIKDKEATVYLKESHEVVFDATAPNISNMADLPHTFALYNEGETWVIYRDIYEDELAKLFKYATKDDIKKQVDENFKNEQNIYMPSEPLTASIYTPSGLANHTYDRTKAVNYANTYWNIYNTAWYKTNPGNDCASFVSQSLYAGEGKTPPNTSGMAPASNQDYLTDWYYVWNNSGSLPWVRVQTQYDFLTGNYGTNRVGPYGNSSTDYRVAYPGDIVQIKQSSIWDHEGIIVVKGITPATTLINAHTTNRYQYPLGYWGVFPWRFILINGWRG